MVVRPDFPNDKEEWGVLDTLEATQISVPRCFLSKLLSFHELIPCSEVLVILSIVYVSRCYLTS